MNACRSIWMLVVGSLVVGCQTMPDPSIELLESELRRYEDQIFAMRRQLATNSAQLDSCQRSNQSIIAGASSVGASSALNTDSTRSSEPTPAKLQNSGSGARAKPDSDIPTDDEIDDLDVPDIDLGTDDVEFGTPESEEIPTPAPSRTPTPNNHTPTEPSIQGDDDDLDIEQIERELDGNVTSIHLNNRLTGGYDFNRHPGHEGLMVVVEPRNRHGQYVAAPGNLSIEVFDPARNIHVARWDFAAAETSRLMRTSLLGKGIHLQLPWPNQLPKSPELRLTVRYVRVDGKRLLAKRDVRVKAESQRPRQLGQQLARPAIGQAPHPVTQQRSMQFVTPRNVLSRPQARTAVEFASRPPRWSPTR